MLLALTNTELNLTKTSITGCIFTAATLLFTLFYSQNAFSNPTIGILQIIAHPALDKTQKGIIDGVKKQYPNSTIIVKNAQGNILNATMISQKFVSDQVDVLVVLGTSAAQAAAKATRFSKTPVVFASITDPIGAKLLKSLEKPEGNVTGVSNYTPLKPQLSYFKKCVPSLKSIGIIYNPGEANSVTLLERTIKAAKDLNIQVIPVAVTKTTEVSMAAQRLASKKVDAIFVNNDNTALSAFDVIARVCLKAKIPLFVSDTDMVVQGALGALGPDQYKLGLQCGDMVVGILKGKDPKDIPVQFPAKVEKFLNFKVAKTIGLFPFKSLKIKADKDLKN